MPLHSIKIIKNLNPHFNYFTLIQIIIKTKKPHSICGCKAQQNRSLQAQVNVKPPRMKQVFFCFLNLLRKVFRRESRVERNLPSTATFDITLQKPFINEETDSA